MNKYKPYRWCVVSSCKNTTSKTPKKLFITLPEDLERRSAWLVLAKRDPRKLSNKTRLFLCEDHFNLEQDMENYFQYKIMGSVKQIRMKANAVPSRFSHSESTRKCKLSPSISQQTITKIKTNTKQRLRLDLVQDAEDNKLVEEYMKPTASYKSDSAETLIKNELQDSSELSLSCETTSFKLCRICGEEKENYIVAKNKPYLSSNKTILTVNDVSVELDFDDVTLSRKICHDCDRKLQETFDFVKLVKNAQLKFERDPLKLEIEAFDTVNTSPDTNDKCDNNYNNKEETSNSPDRVPVNADFVKGTLVPIKTKRKRKHRTDTKTKTDMITERRKMCSIDVHLGSLPAFCNDGKNEGIEVDCLSSNKTSTDFSKEVFHGTTKGPPVYNSKVTKDKCEDRAIFKIKTEENEIADTESLITTEDIGILIDIKEEIIEIDYDVSNE